MTTKDVLTTFEAARICKVSYNTIKNWIKREFLNAYRTAGGHLRINMDDLTAFCREHGIPTDGEGLSLHRKALVADTEESVRLLIKEVFATHPEKFDVYVADDSFEAGCLTELIKPDVIIMDPNMPGINGVKVCREIRKASSLKHAKIVALAASGCGDFEKLGADACLEKPLDRSAFADTIKTLMIPPRGVRAPNKRRKV